MMNQNLGLIGACEAAAAALAQASSCGGDFVGLLRGYIAALWLGSTFGNMLS